MNTKTVSQKDSRSYLWVGIPAIVLALGATYATWRWMAPAKKVPVIPVASPKPAPSLSPLARETEIEGFSIDQPSKPSKKSTPSRHGSLESSNEHGFLLGKPPALNHMPPCEPMETVGFGPQARIAVPDWTKLMKNYHDTKSDLIQWIVSRHFTPELKATLEKSVTELKIQRAPTFEEPDLAWRGIGVLTRSTEGTWMIRTGGGFLQSFQEQPYKGRFELMRLMIQAWPLESGAPWNELLECLNITDSWEARWAISTIIAAQVTSTGCLIPALQETEIKACIKKVSWLGGHVP